jgi:hypothetical protein
MGPVIVHNKALSATEVKEIFERDTARFPLPAVTTPTITLNTTFSKTATLTNTYAFTYTTGMAAGVFAIIHVTARNSSAFNYSSITDSAGNTYIKAAEGTQSNGLTVTAIFYATLTAAVTTATTVTVTATNVGTFAAAQYATVYSTTGGLTTVNNTNTSQTASGTTVVNTTTTSTGAGVALHCASTGLNASPTFTSNSVFTNSITTTESNSGCSAFVATRAFTAAGVGGTITNTMTFSTTGNYAGVLAVFR